MDLVLKETEEVRDHKETEGHRVNLAAPEREVLLESQELEDSQDHLEAQAHVVRQEKLVLRDSLVCLDPVVPREHEEDRAQLDHKEVQVHQDHLEEEDLLD